LIVKTSLKQIDGIAASWLPLARPLDDGIISWASLHGWDASNLQHQRLLVRQALLNAIIRQSVPGITPHAFVTPLDVLGLEAPQPLANEIYEATQSSPERFNFWGELYSALIPQSERRQIGQFWTNEQIAEWMVT